MVARPSVLLTIAQPELKTCQPGYNSYFLNMHMPARPNSFATVSRNTSQNQSYKPVSQDATASDQTCTSQRDRLCFATVSRYTSQNGSSKTGHPGLEVMRGGHTEVVARPSVLLTIAQPELKTCQPGYNRYSSQTCTCQRDQIVSRRSVETHRKTNLTNLSARVQQLVTKRARASATDCVSRRSVDTHRKTDRRKPVTQGWKMLEVVRGCHTEVVARPSVLLTIAQPELKTCQPGYNRYSS